MVDDPFTLDGAGSKRVLGPAMSETLEAVDVLAAPDAFDATDTPQSTADSTVAPLQASTQSALAAALNLAARRSFMARLRAPNLFAVLGFVAGIASDKQAEGHKTSQRKMRK